MGRKILMGCGALSILGVLGVVFVVIAAIVGIGLSSDPTSSPGSQAGVEEGASGQEQAIRKIGQPVPVGNVEWVVTSARQADTLTSSLGDSKNGDFVVVDFTFTNNGSEAVTLDSASLSLLDSEDRKFETDTDTLGYVDPAKDIFLNQVNPGVTQEGEVIFTVAPDASEFKLQLGDTAVFSDENGYVDLGF